MTKNEKCIAVSDVHLGTKESNRGKFIEFIDNMEDDIDRLVLLGDIIDFWRRDPAGVLLENVDIIQKLTSLGPEIDVSYVVGNHDFHLIQLPKSYFGYKFDFKHDLSLEYGGTKYRFIHGHQLENKQFGTLGIYEIFADTLCMAGDDVGKAADMIWDKIGEAESVWDRILGLLGFHSHSSNPHPKITLPWIEKKIAKIISAPKQRNLEALERYAIEMIDEKYKGEFLVYGHTHKPFMEENIANTGSWVEGSTDYLEIDASGVTLASY